VDGAERIAILLYFGPMTARPKFAWRPVTLVAGLVTVLLLATSNGYGYHRDELYFRILGRHLQWGYVDQPPLTPLLNRLSVLVFGDSLWAIRVPFALIIGGLAVLLALLAREVGGGRTAQLLAALGAAGTFPLVGGHVETTATPDLLVWMGVLLFVARALLHDQPRAWLAAGVVTGLGLYNKHLVLLLLICLVAGLLIVGPRRVLFTRWPWLAGGLAVLIGLPNILYQLLNDFPQAHMAAAIADTKGSDDRVQLLPFQLILFGLFFVPVWVAGFVALLKRRELRPIRSFAVAYPILVVLVFVTAGQPYYTIGLIAGLFAIGAVSVERWLAGRRARQALIIAAVVLNTAVSVVFALPVLPADRVGFIADANSTVADQIGWPEYVQEIRDVYAGLSPDDQRKAVLFTGNYGEAGALDRYGRPLGLPGVYSGHNELWNYGPPPDDKTVAIVVTEAEPARVRALFGPCEAGTKLHNREGVDNEEVNASVYVCRQLPATWQDLWPQLQHYD
jgi:4-amino-4-deoxy-L-arabinose transferase-like glycosyltransferase